MKTYNLDMPLFPKLILFLVLGIFTLVAPIFIFTSDGPKVLAIPWIAVVAWNWWVLLTMAHRVVLHDGGILEWVAIGKRVEVLPENIKEIRPEYSGSLGFFLVRHTEGKVRFINQITGFHEVLLHIKSRNPMVLIRGC